MSNPIRAGTVPVSSGRAHADGVLRDVWLVLRSRSGIVRASGYRIYNAADGCGAEITFAELHRGLRKPLSAV
ncbi:hypothetical protein TMPK1_27630 [Rhodospirillales bacterium TMPK1]|uniref:Uncharacterized protein n=1 Tax=Roseiterribacter gracilis TaxID=2812848 RepID=A0A8S8XGY1_9PROT|nr:hypothetical protein TMPK1_27630 [Rhodospirillales bacterium TMPK1]